MWEISQNAAGNLLKSVLYNGMPELFVYKKLPRGNQDVHRHGKEAGNVASLCPRKSPRLETRLVYVMILSTEAVL